MHLFSPIFCGHLRVSQNMRPCILWFLVVDFVCFWAGRGAPFIICEYHFWKFRAKCNQHIFRERDRPFLRNWLQVPKMLHFLKIHKSHEEIIFCLLACPSGSIQWLWVLCGKLLQSQDIPSLLELLIVLQLESPHFHSLKLDAWGHSMLDMHRSLSLPNIGTGLNVLANFPVHGEDSFDATVNECGAN